MLITYSDFNRQEYDRRMEECFIQYFAMHDIDISVFSEQYHIRQYSYYAALLYIYKTLFDDPRRAYANIDRSNSLLDISSPELMYRVCEIYLSLSMVYHAEPTYKGYIILTGISQKTFNQWKKGNIFYIQQKQRDIYNKHKGISDTDGIYSLIDDIPTKSKDIYNIYNTNDIDSHIGYTELNSNKDDIYEKKRRKETGSAMDAAGQGGEGFTSLYKDIINIIASMRQDFTKAELSETALGRVVLANSDREIGLMYRAENAAADVEGFQRATLEQIEQRRQQAAGLLPDTPIQPPE